MSPHLARSIQNVSRKRKITATVTATPTTAVLILLLSTSYMFPLGNCLSQHSTVSNVIGSNLGGATGGGGGGGGGSNTHKYSHASLMSALSGGRHSPLEYSTGSSNVVGVDPSVIMNKGASNVVMGGSDVENNLGVAGAGMRGIVGGRGSRAEINSAGNDNGALSSAATAGFDEPPVNRGEVLASKTFPMSPQEPTCEQLRAMWIFSKRQSRAAEITNEIPTYRDPFAYNIWEPYYSTTRSIASVRTMPRYGEHSHSPVFGRVISREPLIPQRMVLGPQQRQRFSESGMGSPVRIYGAEAKINGAGQRLRPSSQYRLVGANGVASGNQNAVVPVQGSFQKLKELIWTERAKELTQQRRAEEMAARAAVLKEIANGQNIKSSAYNHPFKSESPLMDENRSPDRETEDDYKHYMSDGRMPAHYNGRSQAPASNRNSNNKKGVVKSSPRSYAGKVHNAAHQTSIFTGNHGSSASGNVRGGRLMTGSIYPFDGRERSRSSSTAGTVTGIPKAYPVRPSHFRERNRSLLKQKSPMEYFQREIRHQDLNALNVENALAERIISGLNALEKYQMRQKKIGSQRPFYWVTSSNAALENIQLKQPSIYELLQGMGAEENNGSGQLTTSDSEIYDEKKRNTDKKTYVEDDEVDENDDDENDDDDEDGVDDDGNDNHNEYVDVVNRRKQLNSMAALMNAQLLDNYVVNENDYLNYYSNY